MDYYTVKAENELRLALATIADQQAQIARLQQDAVALRAERDGLKGQVYDLLSLRHSSSMVRCSAVVPQEAE